MLEQYYIRPETIDRIRASWIKEPIERYVGWLADRGYARRNVFHRVPILRQFGEFARARGANTWEALPAHLDAFVTAWVHERARQRGLTEARPKLADEVRRPIEQMLDAPQIRRARPPDDAHHFVAVLEEQLGEI